MVIQKPFLVPGRIEVGLLLASQNYQISFALIGDGCLLLRFLCGELGRQRRTRCQHREINQVSRYRQILKFPSSLRAVLNSFQHASISSNIFSRCFNIWPNFQPFLSTFEQRSAGHSLPLAA